VDDFVRVRLFTPEEAANLLSEARIREKREYVALVLNACVLQYNEAVVPRLRSLHRDPLSLEDEMFRCVVEVNPVFDLKRVAIPVPESEAGAIHLLEQAREGERPRLAELRTMEESLGRVVVGQIEAVSSVSRAVRKALTGLRDPERPIASFFFVGQTGVGKTELAKALTRYLYQDLSKLLRVDCSEYALPHEYAKLLGAPPGYVGHEEGGLLSEARRRGTPVVLFDEVEKSDVKVHHLLLQIMDEGAVTDNKGRAVEFRDAILILTSNLGADEVAAVRDRVGFDQGRRVVDAATLQQETFAALRDFFRPEFLNRLSEVVLFQPLDLRHCEEIARRFLEDVQRHAAAVPLTLRFDRRVPRFLAERAFKPEFGAREV